MTNNRFDINQFQKFYDTHKNDKIDKPYSHDHTFCSEEQMQKDWEYFHNNKSGHKTDGIPETYEEYRKQTLEFQKSVKERNYG